MQNKGAPDIFELICLVNYQGNNQTKSVLQRFDSFGGVFIAFSFFALYLQQSNWFPAYCLQQFGSVRCKCKIQQNTGRLDGMISYDLLCTKSNKCKHSLKSLRLHFFQIIYDNSNHFLLFPKINLADYFNLFVSCYHLRLAHKCMSTH